jgi:hypothetical protein
MFIFLLQVETQRLMIFYKVNAMHRLAGVYAARESKKKVGNLHAARGANQVSAWWLRSEAQHDHHSRCTTKPKAVE